MLATLQQAYGNKDYQLVQQLLSKALIEAIPAEAQQVYEIGALTSVAIKDQSAFDRYMALLFPFYFDQTRVVADFESPCYVLLGLYLLSLLVRNQTAEFHVILERINTSTTTNFSNVYIQFPIQLQQCLVEGTFHRVLLARQQVPSPDYAWFIDALLDTIRYILCLLAYLLFVEMS